MKYASLFEIGSKGLMLSGVLQDWNCLGGIPMRKVVAFYPSDTMPVDLAQLKPVTLHSPKALELIKQAIEVELESDREIAAKAIENPDPLEIFKPKPGDKLTEEPPF